MVMLDAALLNGSRLFGSDPGPVLDGDIFIQGLTNSFFVGVQGGFGWDNVINNNQTNVNGTNIQYTASNLAANEPEIGFYLLDGSYFGDWNEIDNFTRACLGTPTYGLGAVWCGGDTGYAKAVDLASCGLGESVGAAFLQHLNNINTFPQGAHRELAWLGDPTLRLQVTGPPANLIANATQSTVALLWTPSAETNVQYFIYRSSSPGGPFTNHVATVSVNAWTDTAAPPPGSRTYGVKTAQLVVTGSGSYTNLSQAVLISP